jgi:hypothetical protein
MFDEASGVSSQFDKGQIVFDAKTQQSGVIVSGAYFEFSGQFVYRVHVAGVACLQSWGESRLTVSVSVAAVSIGDMVIAHDRYGEQTMGQVIGKRDGKLICRFADGDFLVAMSRVWRVWPAALVFSPVRAAVLKTA